MNDDLCMERGLDRPDCDPDDDTSWCPACQATWTNDLLVTAMNERSEA